RPREIPGPAIQYCAIQLILISRLRVPHLARSQHFPGCGEIAGYFVGQDLAQLRALRGLVILNGFFGALDLLLVLLISLYLRLGRERILGVRRAGEDAAQRVVVFDGKRIVLVIVATRAGDRDAEEPARNDIDTLLTLVGARDGRLGQIEIPRAESH